jgi:AGZA family xanthine/uracil permease-like MFS transporter
MADKSVPLWGAGDWNGFFGLGTNVLLNLLVLTGILGAIGMPLEIIFGRILPAVGLMLFLGNMYYAWMAKRLADRTGRDDVTALPSGPSVPHMFFVVFVIMLPIKIATGDPIRAWEAGLAWVFVEGVVLFLGAFIAPYVRKYMPRAALLGTLAGISITFISMMPAFRMMEQAIIGLVCFAIILGAWFGGVRFPGRVPGGLVAIGVGTLLAWISYVFGLGLADVTAAGVVDAVGSIGFSIPIPAFDHVFSGFDFFALIVVTAVPFGIYDFVEAMDNVESAAAAGDEYSVREAVGAEGVISIIGTLLGSPFANAVYIGHPGWKSIGGRIGYSIGTGVMVLVLTWLAIVPLLLAIIPLVAIIPILLYIGALIGAQAFQATPKNHAPAVVLALVPNLALWLKIRVDGALQAAGWNPGAGLNEDQIASLGNNGVLYEGLAVLSGGAIVVGLLWGGMAAFIIERKHQTASIVAAIAAVLSWFGFIHGPAIGWMVAPTVAVAYLAVAVVIYGFSKMEAEPA